MISVPVLGDTLDEVDETYSVNLSDAVNATIADGTGLGTIVDNDPAPSLSINNVTVTEGDTTSVNAVFTVTLSAASGKTVTVNYGTTPGTATANVDYTPSSGVLTFTPGTTTQKITVPVLGDVLDENNETFAVNLSGAVNATISTASGTGTITDNDPTPSLSINDISVLEGNSGFTDAVFTVTLSKVSGRAVTVNFSVPSNGTASKGSDYIQVSGTVTFAPGTTIQMIHVQVVGDTKREPNEWFRVTLANVVNASIAKSTGTCTILNDD
jgi:hypothetical protein